MSRLLLCAAIPPSSARPECCRYFSPHPRNAFAPCSWWMGACRHAPACSRPLLRAPLQLINYTRARLETPLLSPPSGGRPHSTMPCSTPTPPLCWISSCCPTACPTLGLGAPSTALHCSTPHPAPALYGIPPSHGTPWGWWAHGCPVGSLCKQNPRVSQQVMCCWGVSPTIPRMELRQSKLRGAQALGAQQTLHTHPNTPPLLAGMHRHSCADRDRERHRCTGAHMRRPSRAGAHRHTGVHRDTVRQRERHRCTYTRGGTHRQTDRRSRCTDTCTLGTHIGG